MRRKFSEMRRFTAAPSEERCEATITYRDGSGAQCMRARRIGIYCKQHAKLKGETMDNEQRRAQAEEALMLNRDYQEDRLSTDETITDLLTNLRHLCKRELIDFNKLVTSSEIHFEAEQ